MKFDKSPQPSLIDNSTLILDSEYESDHMSTIDIPSWSDQSTLHSIDDKVSLVSAALVSELVFIYLPRLIIASMDKPCNLSSRQALPE
jgi:hypothetical protein